MRLNPDCIRDILFAIEDLSKYNSILTSTQLAGTEFLTKYSNDEILYHLQQLAWSHYIVTPNNNKSVDGYFFVNDLSPAGHEFLSDVRENTNWNKVKSISKEVGSETLTCLKSIATSIIASAIKNSIGLN